MKTIVEFFCQIIPNLLLGIVYLYSIGIYLRIPAEKRNAIDEFFIMMGMMAAVVMLGILCCAFVYKIHQGFLMPFVILFAGIMYYVTHKK